MSKLITLPLFFIALVFTSLANAHNQLSRNNTPILTIYKDCEFDGSIDALTMGDYRDMGSTRLGNDQVSSLHVPHDMVAIVYEDANFEGKSEVIKQDVECLPRDWNDRISSIRFIPQDNLSYYVDPKKDQYNKQVTPVSRWNKTQQPVANNINICHPYKLYTNGGSGGFRTIKSAGADDFKRSDGQVVTGEICGSGLVQISLLKEKPKTTTIIEVNNQRFVFAPNQRHDKFRNKWYRKYYKVDLSEQSG